LTSGSWKNWAGTKDWFLLAGRYEGVDERLLDAEIEDEISIGDYVLSGGELPAMVLMDALIRRIPGALNDASRLSRIRL